MSGKKSSERDDDVIDPKRPLHAPDGGLRHILDSAVDHAIVAADLTSRIVEWNAGAAAIFGWSAAEAVGLPLGMIYSAEDRKAGAPERDLGMTLSAGRAEIDRALRKKDDTTLWGVGVTTPLREAGRIVGILAIVRDGSEQHARALIDRRTHRESSDAAFDSDAQFQMLAESIPQLAWMADASGSIYWYNRRWFDYTGTDLETMKGWGWRGVHHPDHVERVTRLFRTCLETGRAWEDTFPLKGADGIYRWFLSRAAPVLSSDGTIQRWFGTNTDITEIEHARKLLAAQTDALNSQVEGQTRELVTSRRDIHEANLGRSMAESQVRQLQKMEAVGQLTGGIAHDFNNMLAVIIGGLNLLTRRLARGDTDVTRFADAAMEGATRAAALTARMLAFSRQQPLNPEPLSANDLVAGLSDLLRRSIGETVELDTILADDLWKSKIDTSQLENAILNLAVNARDAMPDGGRLTIETANAHLDEDYARENEIEAGPYVMIAVTDTGSGMAPEVVSRAFEPFFTTKGIGKGTGLGLSQTYGFVRQSHGHIKIESEVDQGTTFKLYLPRYFGTDGTGWTRPTAVSEAPRGGSPNEIIFVVEDEDRVRMITVDALRELGYSVVHAASGQEALDLLETHADVTLLFTDVVMPGMTGRQLADKVKLVRPELRVLFTTGYTRDAVVHDGTLDAGTNFLSKPFSIDQLAAKIRGVLDA